ncbi:P2-like prophage tail protein X [Azotobacter beijerinckii]|uniref:P2-like prophage tail protein X n=1 Tax=Azotobacter beijerinckii TaxID=170623 RepID=A0A1H9MQS4_9GAMM|nr:tail protein X [Azotobacter beijerinckii]SER25849.1 P2-like prophage tail protein X [Azotobacter beijerinckii]
MAAVIAHQGDTLDALCWRHYGRTAGVVEAVLEANPGLADLGPILPHGQRVTLPEQAPQPQTQTVQLWD